MKKGPLAEAQVIQCLQEHGWPYAERRVMGGTRDRGDVAGIPGVVIEVKNHAAMALAEWVDESVTEADAEGKDRMAANCRRVHPSKPACDVEAEQYQSVGVVWHKRRGKGNPLDWYVTMTGRDFIALLAAYTDTGASRSIR